MCSQRGRMYLAAPPIKITLKSGRRGSPTKRGVSRWPIRQGRRRLSTPHHAPAGRSSASQFLCRPCRPPPTATRVVARERERGGRRNARHTPPPPLPRRPGWPGPRRFSASPHVSPHHPPFLTLPPTAVVRRAVRGRVGPSTRACAPRPREPRRPAPPTAYSPPPAVPLIPSPPSRSRPLARRLCRPRSAPTSASGVSYSRSFCRCFVSLCLLLLYLPLLFGSVFTFVFCSCCACCLCGALVSASSLPSFCAVLVPPVVGCVLPRRAPLASRRCLCRADDLPPSGHPTHPAACVGAQGA